MTRVEGIPCTSLARTLLDLADVVSQRELERACDQAEVLQLFDLHALEDVLERARGRRGVRALRAALTGQATATTLTRSELEEGLLELCRAARLPAPQLNAWIALDGGGLEADFLWREQRLIVETDGRQVHTTSQAFERDRRRDQRLVLAGWRVVRFTWRQVVREPAIVEATIRALLRERPSPGRVSGPQGDG